MNVDLRHEMERWSMMTVMSRSMIRRAGVVATLTLTLVAFPTDLRAQEEESEQVFRFSDASRPGLLRLNLMHANAEVIGYDGDEVLIETEGGVSIPLPPRPPRQPGRAPRPPRPAEGADLAGGERNNVLTVRSRAFELEITIRVPRGTSINFNGALGDLTVQGVEGTVTVNKQAGDVDLRDIVGSATVQTLAGDVFVSFAKVDPTQSMSFSTLSGTLEAVLPEDTRATVRVENMIGEIESEFEIVEMRPRRERPDNRRNTPRRKLMIGELTGGGSNILLRNTTGDVILRKREP